MANASEKSSGRHIEFLESPIDESGVTQSRETPLNELLGRPLITRLNEPGRDPTEERLLIVPQRVLQMIGPISWVWQKHRKGP